MHHPWRGSQTTSSKTGRQSAPPACSACTGCGHSSPQPQSGAAAPRAPASMPSVVRLKSGRLSLPVARCASGRCAQPGLPTAADCRYATPVASLLDPWARASSKQQLLRPARVHHKRADSGRSGAGRARRAGSAGQGGHPPGGPRYPAGTTPARRPSRWAACPRGSPPGSAPAGIGGGGAAGAGRAPVRARQPGWKCHELRAAGGQGRAPSRCKGKFQGYRTGVKP